MMHVPAPAAPQPYRYIVRFPAPSTHYAEVEAVFPAEKAPSLELMMAVWTPGSYLIREYARNIEGITASGDANRPLEIHKTRKNRWMIATKGVHEVTIRYRLYCWEMSVRTNWVDENFALLNGAATFLTVPGKLNNPHEVMIVLPPTWQRVMTGLEQQTNHFIAPDFDTLADSPILAGNPAVYEFAVDGKNHYLVNEGEGGLWNGPRAAADARRIVEFNLQMWGSLPYSRYVFLNLITEAFGGLEHKNSTCLMTSRWSMRTRQGYLRWLALLSHEYFHAWNVKRLRPADLGPFNYENENYTKGLWVSEGFTEYYGTLNVRRAGLSTTEEYLGQTNGPDRPDPETLSGLIEALQRTPGRLEQPVEAASFDAWIKQYRPDENSVNTSISYYTKGAVIAWLLDARIRKATGNLKSLDDVMRLAYERYSGPRGFTDEGFRRTAQDVAGVDLSQWFHDVLETTEELDYSEALDWFGLRFKTPAAAKKASPGFVTKTDNGRMIVTQVPRGTPAFAAGFNADDEILALDGYRVRPEQWQQRMEQYRPGDHVSILVSRRDKIEQIGVTLTEESVRNWQLEIRPDRTTAQKLNLAAWLGS